MVQPHRVSDVYLSEQHRGPDKGGSTRGTLLRKNPKQGTDGLIGFSRVAKFHLTVECVDIPSSDFTRGDVSRLLKITENHLRASFGDADIGCNVLDKTFRIAAQVNQNVAVVREESPLADCVAFLAHIRILPEM